MPELPLYATIAIDRAAGAVDKELTYAIPPGIAPHLRIGQAVAVPLRAGKTVGYITGFAAEPETEAQIKNIYSLLAREPLFDALALKLARWMAAYYHCSLADCLTCFIPAGAAPSLEQKYRFAAEEPLRALRDLGRSPRLFAVANTLFEAQKADPKPLTQKELEKKLGSKVEAEQLRRLCDAGVLEIAEETANVAVKPRHVGAVKLTPRGERILDPATMEKLERTAPKQAAALREVAARGGLHDFLPVKALFEAAGIETVTLRALQKKDMIEWGKLESRRAPLSVPRLDEKPVVLTDEQVAAVDVLSRSLEVQSLGVVPALPATALLQGVTASGKTEVYLAAIEKCLALGRTALVLVPEIALTAQTVEVFQGRFGSEVAILHSALSAGERYDEWRRAGRGEARIVVGARSAVFAPCRNVGLIIIDEEHDHSYKQDATPRYHARDVALRRAALEKSVLVLGSATPSLESYARATRSEYSHVYMRKRVADRKMPEVEIVDMTGEAKGGLLPVLSARLREELCNTVTRGEQAILFLNRRGFATYVQCIGCGHVERCPNCDVSLTHHRGESTLRCHHCDHSIPVPGRCPKCDGGLLSFSGSGTEKVESEVTQLFQERGLGATNILRLDRDTTAAKGSHSKILGDFRVGKASVLIGTQMVTKGLDFPHVTLVGVISADTALNVPDFRAAERTFQLLAQVSGRAGRGEKPGKVLIQTLASDDFAITNAAQHNFEAFVKEELESRSVIPNPPFSHIVNIISQDEDESLAKDRIQRLAAKFLAASGEDGSTEVLGPVDCPISRVKGKFRYHLMLRDKSRPRLHQILEIYDQLPREAKEGLTVDVDAMTIL